MANRPSHQYTAAPIKGSDGGLNFDLAPSSLLNNSFSAGANVRFKDGKAQKFLGHSIAHTPAIAPYWLLPVPQLSNYYWITAGLNKVYVTDLVTNWNITRQDGVPADVDYAATADKNWNGGIITGIPILNNGVDDPQMWNPAQTSQRLTSLTYDAGNTWADMNYQCGVMRVFKSYLIALDVTKAGTNYPYMVKWSHPATPGAVPVSWDESDTTKLAGETEVGDAGGFVIDALKLGNLMMIYTESSVWYMQEIGGNDIFEIQPLFHDFGILSRRCVKPFKNRHLVLSHGDLIMHDGRDHDSVINKKMQTWLSTNIDTDNGGRSFLANNFKDNEIWVCFPQQGSTLPDMAMVWNYKDNQIGIRDLPNVPHIGYGVINPGGDLTIDAQSQIIDTDTSIIDARQYNPSQLKLLVCDPTNTELYLFDDTNQFNGTNFTARIERTDIPLGTGRMTVLKEFWPQFEGSGTVTITIGSQKKPGAAITWESPQTFTIGTDEKIDCWSEGYYGAFKIETTNSNTWEYISSYFTSTDGSVF